MRVKLHQLLSTKFLSSPCLSDTQKGEVDAIISHFLQTPLGDIPLLDKNNQADLVKIANSFFSQEEGILYGAEPDELPTIELPNLFNNLPYPPPKTWNFTFIDLFAGIGGFRQAFQNVGGKCVFSSEWNKYAQKT